MSQFVQLRLLERAFTPQEWRYLCQDAAFKSILLKGDTSADDFEKAVEIGCLLLRRREELVTLGYQEPPVLQTAIHQAG